MLREPRPQQKVERAAPPPKGRFRLVRLEERIAPRSSHTNNGHHHRKA
jgi:hypothetical protein